MAAIAAGGACAFGFLQAAVAQPQVPATYYGTAAIDGKSVADGTEVRGYIDALDCTQPGPTYRGTITDGGVSVYLVNIVHESQKAGCGKPGKTVTFTVGGRPATQTAEWKQGPQQVNLNAGSGEAPALPTATPTRTLAPSEAAATATGQAKFTPKPATELPTDEAVIVIGTRTAEGAEDGRGGEGASGSGEEGGLAVGYVLLVVLGAIVLTGGAMGVALSRRTVGRGTNAEPGGGGQDEGKEP
ncbi:MAG: hypothetical protein DYG91_07200 [Chloroflexi bacterium CFX7]|nr:hypothetical protein [Chloroflexi bacterium CFX7]RIL03788.1 MAG: hypothetical protein DCC78_03275 [bacterium]